MALLKHVTMFKPLLGQRLPCVKHIRCLLSFLCTWGFSVPLHQSASSLIYNKQDDCNHHHCHWWELQQVSFLLWQKFCSDKHMFVVTKIYLLWQKYTCRDKTLAQTKLFVVTICFGCDKSFVMTKDMFCHNKRVFVRAKVFFLNGHEKHVFLMTKTCFVATNTCFVMTNTFCSQQKYACHDKTFVVTKITCSSSCQWYTTSTTSNINMHLPDSWRLTWE